MALTDRKDGDTVTGPASAGTSNSQKGNSMLEARQNGRPDSPSPAGSKRERPMKPYRVTSDGRVVATVGDLAEMPAVKRMARLAEDIVQLSKPTGSR